MSDISSPGLPYAGLWGPAVIVDSGGSPVTNTAFSIYTGTSTSLATLYTDQTKANKAANPSTTDAYGNALFYAAPGLYTLSINVNGVVTTYAITVQPWFPDAVWNNYSVTVSSTLNSGDAVYVNGSASVNITLPPTQVGARVKVTNIGTTNVGVTAQTGTIQGPGVTAAGGCPLFTQNSFVELFCDGTNWHIVGGELDTGWNPVTYENSYTGDVVYRILAKQVLFRGGVNTNSSISSPVPAFYCPNPPVPLAVPLVTSAGTFAYGNIASGSLTPYTPTLGQGFNVDGLIYTVD
jgi:hypothetical protein